MVAFQVDTSGLTRMERSLGFLANKQLHFAMARALNDCTRAASVDVNKAMPSVFDRPTPFTERAAVAPRDLAASRDHLVATVTLRDIQAKYLTPEEEGGARSPSDNTRKPGQALVLPGKGLDLDSFGNIPNGTLRRLRAMAKADRRARRKRAAIAAKHKLSTKVRGSVEVGPRFSPPRSGTVFFLPGNAAANKAGIGGYFMRLNKGQITRLTAFEGETHYHARMSYHDRVQRIFLQTWHTALPRRLAEALADAR